MPKSDLNLELTVLAASISAIPRQYKSSLLAVCDNKTFPSCFTHAGFIRVIQTSRAKSESICD